MPGGNLTIIGLCVAGGLLVILGIAGMVRKARSNDHRTLCRRGTSGDIGHCRDGQKSKKSI